MPDTTVGQVLERTNGSIKTGPFGTKLAAREYSAIGTPVISVGEVGYGAISLTDRTKRVGPDVTDRMPEYLLESGDIVFGRKGAVDRSAWLRPPEAGYFLGSDGIRLRFGPGADSRFMAYQLQSDRVRSWLLQHAVGTTLASLNEPTLRAVPVDMPPITVQRGIAGTLGALDDKIESNRRAVAILEELVRSHFGRLFVTENVSDGVPLSQLFEVNPRRSLRIGDDGTYVGMSSLPEFAAEVYEWERKAAGSGRRFIDGDVLMARITPCLENGKTAVVDMLADDEVGWGSTEYIVLAPKGAVTTPWIYSLVRSDAVRTFAIVSMTGTSGRQRFQADRFDQYKIADPEISALDEFNQLTLPMFARMTQLRDESLGLARVRDALLPELLSGRIRVPEMQKAVV